jgi:hypothetical protein
VLLIQVGRVLVPHVAMVKDPELAEVMKADVCSAFYELVANPLD